MGVAPLVRFIIERERTRINKESGKPRPWTADPIIGKYRFCNVRREDDSVTRWLRSEYYPCYRDDPDLWFAAVVARLFNNPETLDEITHTVLPFKPELMRKALHRRKRDGEKVFNAAYIVSTNGIAMDKIDYVVLRVLGPLWADRKNMRPWSFVTLWEYHEKLMKHDGLGSFLAAQVVADLKYADECELAGADDWDTFAASGPGSRRGLNRVLNIPPERPWKEAEWRRWLGQLQKQLNAELKKKPRLFTKPLHAQDVQNCLCEFDKYERARLGEGTPKQIYKEK